MPCEITDASLIQIAHYGLSPQGQLKHIYRRGLGHRYGRMMQVIAGVHFNYSVHASLLEWQAEQLGQAFNQQWISARYFNALRNLQHHGWLVAYLFGASPALDRSFTANHSVQLHALDDHTLYHPHATSLRLSDIGYSNANLLEKRRCAAQISFDNLEDYVADLLAATQTVCSDYQTLGVLKNSEYQQLNPNLLQIENEFYATVRPKQAPFPQERPLAALARRGVGYLELRTLDLNPLHPLGVDAPTLHFLEAFILFNLLVDAPSFCREERLNSVKNQQAVALFGRQPHLQLNHCGQPLKLTKWAHAVLEAMTPICLALDHAHQTHDYQKTLSHQKLKVTHPELTPSAELLQHLESQSVSFSELILGLAEEWAVYFRASPLNETILAQFRHEVYQSHREQQHLEQCNQTQSFADFLAQYFQWPDDLTQKIS